MLVLVDGDRLRRLRTQHAACAGPEVFDTVHIVLQKTLVLRIDLEMVANLAKESEEWWKPFRAVELAPWVFCSLNLVRDEIPAITPWVRPLLESPVTM
jgi:hypothetical protein